MMRLFQTSKLLGLWPNVREWLSVHAYDLLRVFLSLALLSAAALKAFELSNEALSVTHFWNSRPFLVVLVLTELGFGLWLLFGLYPRWSRWAAVGLFLAFLEFSLLQGLLGQKTCHCLGRTEISPWIMFGFDALVVWCLLVVRPRDAETAESTLASSRLFAFGVLFGVIAIPALLSMAFYAPRGPMLDLRTDRQLGVRVPLDLKLPTTEEILNPIRKATGLTISVDPSLENDRPNYGRVGPTKMAAWSVMEFVAEQQPLAARWDRVEGGYHLRNASPLGNRLRARAQITWSSWHCATMAVC